MTWCRGPICQRCSLGLGTVPATVLTGNLRVISAFAHGGVARCLVHRLKYGGLVAAGEVLAERLEELLPPNTRALVPVPRALVRRAKYGTDPAFMLASLIRRRTGLPVVCCLRPPLWWPAQAGSSREARRPPPLRLRRVPPGDSLLVDDVITTGATLRAAAASSGIGVAITATRAGTFRPD